MHLFTAQKNEGAREKWFYQCNKIRGGCIFRCDGIRLVWK